MLRYLNQGASLAIFILLPAFLHSQVNPNVAVQRKNAGELKISGNSKGAATLSQAPKKEKKIQGKSIEFLEEVYEFGKVNTGKKVEHTYEFRNNGTENVKIETVKTSCGCTAAKYSKKTVPPGEMGFVRVRFNTKKKGGLQFKTITVVYGGDKPTVLYLKGEVLENGDN